MNKSAGFSLLELMIVLGLSSIVLLASQQLFFHYQQRSKEGQLLFRAQANIHMALQILHHALYDAGEAGCQSITQLEVSVQAVHLPDVIALLPVHGYAGLDGRWQPPLPEHWLQRAAINTDVVLIEGASKARWHLAQAIQDARDPIRIQQGNFAQGDIVLIADCHHADLFRISAIKQDHHEQLLLPSASLSHAYAEDAQVMHWQVDAYYIAQSTRIADSFGLYHKRLLPDHPPIELVADLLHLSANYAFLQQGKVHSVHAGSVPHWPSVKAVALTVKTHAPKKERHVQGQLTVPLYNAAGG